MKLVSCVGFTSNGSWKGVFLKAPRHTTFGLCVAILTLVVDTPRLVSTLLIVHPGKYTISGYSDDHEFYA